MPRCKFLNACFLAAAIGLLASQASAIEDLNDVLRDTKWNRIIGTWVDEGTKGAGLKLEYVWKIKNHVIEQTRTEGTKKEVSLIGLNAKTGKIFQVGADSSGGSYLSEWTTKTNGDAIIGIGFTSPDGQNGALSIRQRLEGNDAMVITVELPEPIVIKMVRDKSKTTGRR